MPRDVERGRREEWDERMLKEDSQGNGSAEREMSSREIV